MNKMLIALAVAAGTLLPMSASAQTAAAKPAPAPAAATAKPAPVTDAMCFVSVTQFIVILSENPDKITAEMRDTSDRLHRALGFYAARLEMLQPARLKTEIQSAASTVGALDSAKQAELASNCLDGVSPALSKIVEALK